MPFMWMAAAVAGSALVGGVVQSRSADKAADATTAANQAAIEEQRRQFNETARLLRPFIEAATGSGQSLQPQMELIGLGGEEAQSVVLNALQADPSGSAGGGRRGGSLEAQLALLGLSGADAQAAAIRELESSPQFTSLLQQGEEAILQNASATGGLRGGNTQDALMRFRPAALSSVINDQYMRLAGLTQMGQASAAGQASAGIQTGQSVSSLLQGIGAARAGSQLATGQAVSNVANTAGQLALLHGMKII